jgi:hypothetical protein
MLKDQINLDEAFDGCSRKSIVTYEGLGSYWGIQKYLYKEGLPPSLGVLDFNLGSLNTSYVERS